MLQDFTAGTVPRKPYGLVGVTTVTVTVPEVELELELELELEMFVSVLWKSFFPIK